MKHNAEEANDTYSLYGSSAVSIPMNTPPASDAGDNGGRSSTPTPQQSHLGLDQNSLPSDAGYMGSERGGTGSSAHTREPAIDGSGVDKRDSAYRPYEDTKNMGNHGFPVIGRSAHRELPLFAPIRSSRGRKRRGSAPHQPYDSTRRLTAWNCFQVPRDLRPSSMSPPSATAPGHGQKAAPRPSSTFDSYRSGENEGSISGRKSSDDGRAPSPTQDGQKGHLPTV
ncbi:hypothetical protein QFC21_006997 [Naganishia friedmannii]|uniref:Uncharacterized protein n=1 Tax=Naganishia friedmannii TaxID=89922 RepID=A0ACC2UYG4_9TREE|nr:hypothetical protein QFC21_006997 [Naganishia friedmannii]